MSIKLGSLVKDNISGFTGIVTARTEWLFGCARCGVEATEIKDGKLIDAQWFDEQRLDVLEERKIEISIHSSATVGGDKKDPMRNKDPMN